MDPVGQNLLQICPFIFSKNGISMLMTDFRSYIEMHLIQANAFNSKISI